MFAVKKYTSLGNILIRNKQMSYPSELHHNQSQKCNRNGCLQCERVDTEKHFIINGNPLKIPNSLNCKSKNIIYMWPCNLCGPGEVYFGRTAQECHNR